MGILDGLQGLLGTSFDDPRTMAAFQAAGLLSGGGSNMQRFAGAGQAYGGAMAQARQLEEQRKTELLKRGLLESQIAETKAQAGEREANAAKLARAVQDDQAFRADLQSRLNPVSGPQAIGAPGQAGPTLDKAPLIGARPPVDYQGLMAKWPARAKEIGEIAGAADLGKPEVARTIEGKDAQGRPVTFQYDKQGRLVGTGIPKAVEMKLADLGGTQTAYDAYGLQPGQSFTKTQTADGKASNAVAWANVGTARDRLAFDQTQAGKPQFHDGSWVSPPNATNPNGTAVQVPGFSKPLTESQGNAAAFYMRANNALENLNSVDSISNGNYWASKLPWGTGNFMMSAAGQKAMNAEKQFIAGLLRKESGAAISNGEYQTYGEQFFPRPGDSAEKLAQKERNRAVAIEGLKVQAGGAGVSQADAGLQRVPKPGGRISTDAEYNALPSGTTFQAPDGTMRRKP